MAEAVRMVRCVYTLQGESEWVPMGRARTRCPRCGAGVKPAPRRPGRVRGARRRPESRVEDSTDRFHVVVRREEGS